MRKKLAKITNGTRNNHIRRGRAIMDKKDEEPEEVANNLAIGT